MKEYELWNELGNLYFLSSTYDRAVRAYNHSIDLSPERGESYTNLALTYVQMGKLSDASDCYQRGIPLLKDELDKAVSMQRLGNVHLQLMQFTQAAEAFRQAEELVADLGQIIADYKPADFLLHCSETDLQLQKKGGSNELLLHRSFDAEMPPFVEELTPWWFDNQILPDEELDADYDYWYFNDAGVHSPNENIVSTEPLSWELNRSREENMPGYDCQIDNVTHDVQTNDAEDKYRVDNEIPEILSMSVSHEAVVNNLVREDVVDEALAAGSTVEETDSTEIVTDAPEFSSENLTSPEAVQYEIPVDWPMVELTHTERLEIQAEINRFKRVLEINPSNAFAWDSLGGSYKSLGQYNEAIESYQKAVSLDSTKAFYFHHLGLVYAAVGRYDDAIDAFERVIDVDPNHSLAHATLGGYYRKKGNEKLAKQHIEKARILLAKDENDYNRACMAAICGNTEQSLELLELALKNKQTYVNWAQKDPDLDFIRSDPRFHTLLAEYSLKTT